MRRADDRIAAEEERNEERTARAEARANEMTKRNQDLHDQITDLARQGAHVTAGVRSAIRHLRIEVRVLQERLSHPAMSQQDERSLRDDLLSERPEEPKQ